MASLGTLAVNIVARTEKFTAGVTKSLSQVQRFAGGVVKLTAAVTALGAATGVAAVALGSVFVKRQFEVIDALGKSSDKIGIATERLAGLHLAASEAGVATSALETGLLKLSKSVSEAKEGRGTGLYALKTLQLDAETLQRLSLPDQLLAVADAMQKLGNHGDKVRVAMELFGRGGAPLLNLLKNGKVGLDEAQDAARKLGLVISRDMAAAVERANDAFGRVKMTIVGLARQIAVRVAPLIEMASKKFVSFITDNDKIVTVADTIARAFVKAGAIVLRVFSEISASVRELGAEILDIIGSLPRSVLGSDGKPYRIRADVLRGHAFLDRKQGEQRASNFEKSGLAMLDKWLNQLRRANDNTDKNLALSDRLVKTAAAEAAGSDWQKRFKGGGLQGQYGDRIARLYGKGVNTQQAAVGSALAFTETGSVESYRQRAAIRRQGETNKEIKAVAKNTAASAESLRGVWQAMQRGVPLMPANLAGS